MKATVNEILNKRLKQLIYVPVFAKDELLELINSPNINAKINFPSRMEFVNKRTPLTRRGAADLRTVDHKLVRTNGYAVAYAANKPDDTQFIEDFLMDSIDGIIKWPNSKNAGLEAQLIALYNITNYKILYSDSLTNDPKELKIDGIYNGTEYKSDSTQKKLIELIDPDSVPLFPVLAVYVGHNGDENNVRSLKLDKEETVGLNLYLVYSIANKTVDMITNISLPP